MTDLRTTYLGMELRNPLVASASPLNAAVADIVELEDYGAAAVVLPSIFEEQIEAEHAQLLAVMASAESSPEAASYFPDPEAYIMTLDRYLDLIRRARENVRIPVIASLNGTSGEGWIEYAMQLEKAGASALELNIYFIPADISLTSMEVERRYSRIVADVKSAVRIPVAVKASPYFTAVGALARNLQEAGADGLVLFNRFYQPDIDLVDMTLRHDLELSNRNETRLPLLWISLLAGRVRPSLAASSGVDGAAEVVKYILAGADVVMTTSSLLRYGIEHMATLVDGLQFWLESKGYASVAEARGIFSHGRVADPVAFERANYIRVLRTFSDERVGRI